MLFLLLFGICYPFCCIFPHIKYSEYTNIISVIYTILSRESSSVLCLPYQWVSLCVALRHLLGRSSLLGRAVAVVSHVLRPQLEQRLTVLLQRGSVPRIRVVHPLGWIFPRRSFAVQLQVCQKGRG